jgi:two-component system sensor kinase FixL
MIAVEQVEWFRRKLGPFVAAAEATRMPMLFTDAKTSGNPIIFTNKSFLDLTGYGEDEVLSQTLGFVLADMADQAAIERLNCALAGGCDEELELECRRKDGTMFLAAVFLCPVRNDSGEIIQNFISLVALTGHVDRLLQQRNELHALYQHAPGFIATMEGPEHRFSFVNIAYETLVGRDELRGRPVVEALPELAAQGFIELLDKVYATGEHYTGQDVPVMLNRVAGEVLELRYLDLVYQPIRNARDRVTGVFCEGHDVTDKKLALDHILLLQEELIHLTRVSAMGTMATTLAHELTQPLTAIANYCAAAKWDLDLPIVPTESLHASFAGISEGANRAGEIIRHLRDMTKRGKPHRSFFDLGDAVQECVLLVRGMRHDGVEIVSTCGNGMTIDADRVQLQQVVLNLIRNACEAVLGSDRRVVTVTVDATSEQATVAVADTGTGVPLQVARTLFQWSTSSKTEGMGIGLSISRTIIESHGGRIWLENSGPTGSCFAFSIPVDAGDGLTG